MSSTEVLQVLRDICTAENISDASVTNLNFKVDLTSCTTDELSDILRVHRDSPDYFGALQIRVLSGEVLFERRGGRIVVADTGFETLSEADLDVDLDHYRGGFDRYRDEDLGRASEFVHDLAAELSDSGETVELQGLLNKTAIAEGLLEDQFSERIIERVNPHLWWSPRTFSNWLEQEEISNATQTLYTYERSLLLLFIDDTPEHSDVCTIWSATGLDRLNGRTIDDTSEVYRDRIEHARSATSWEGELMPLHPDQVLGLRAVFGEALNAITIHSLLAAFSKSVELVDQGVKYTISYEPEFHSTQQPAELQSLWGNEGIEAVEQLYSKFKKHEEKDAFRDLWQLAITEQCLDEDVGLESLPELAPAIQSANEDLQVSAIEENFDELSDVLEDTQTLMADLTNRLSDAAAETSRDIQRLTFTLLGAIVANIFLVLRWSDRTLVPSFSIFVIVLLVGFYLPLIQGRITDLGETITQVEADYDFYEKRIRRFNKDLFNLTGLSDRKDGYVQMAKDQRDRGQSQLEVVFGSLLLVWTVLCAWSAIGFRFGGLKTASLITSALILGVISLTNEERYWSHRNHEYFHREWALIVLGLILILIALQWGIGEFDHLSGLLPDSLPRFTS